MGTMQFLRSRHHRRPVCRLAGIDGCLAARLRGTKGKRRAVLPHAGKIMIHQPLIGGMMQEHRDLTFPLKRKKCNKTVTRIVPSIMSHHTGQTVEKIHKDCDRNLWLNAAEGAVKQWCGRSRGHDQVPLPTIRQGRRPGSAGRKPAGGKMRINKRRWSG